MEKKKSVLVVDDEPMLLEVVKSMLESHYEVGLTDSASGALNFLNKNLVDCILLDITMPNINGFEFLKDIRKIPSYFDVPIIIVSGNTGKEFFNTAKNSSAFDVLTKPIKKDLLISTIEKAMTK